MRKLAYVYILASKKNGTLYTGVTNNLERRMYEHKHHLLDGFTKKYDVTRLVWFTQGEDIRAAISLEKKIKNRNRQWKIDLIEKTNPSWNDLAASCDSAQDDGHYSEQDDTLRSVQDAGLRSAPPDCHSARSRGIHNHTSNNGSCDFAQDDTLRSAQDDTLRSAQDDTLRSVQDAEFKKEE